MQGRGPDPFLIRAAVGSRRRLIARVVVIEPLLRDEVGHFYQYLAAVQAALERRQIKTFVLGCKEADAVCHRLNGFYPAFDHACPSDGSRLARLRSLLTSAYGFYRELTEVLLFRPVVKLEPGDILFMDTLTDPQTVGWGLFLHSNADRLVRLDLTFVFVLRFSPVRGSALHATLIKTIERGVYNCLPRPLRRRVILTTDSELLRQEYGSLLNMPLTILPIPIVPAPQAAGASAPGRALTVTYVGRALQYKGFDLFVEAISKLRGTLGGVDRIRVQAEQHHQAELERHPQIAEAVGKLQGLVKEMPNLEVVPDTLTSAQHRELLAQSDLVVLPHRGRHYASSTSSVMAETLSLGRIPIVPRQTWTGHELIKLGLEDLVFESQDVDSLAATILNAIQHRDRYLDKVRLVQEQWRSFHNPESFVDTFLQVVRGVESPGGHA